MSSSAVASFFYKFLKILKSIYLNKYIFTLEGVNYFCRWCNLIIIFQHSQDLFFNAFLGSLSSSFNSFLGFLGSLRFMWIFFRLLPSFSAVCKKLAKIVKY